MTKTFEKNHKQYDLIDVFLAGAAPKVGRYDLPQLAPENYIPETQVLPFNYFTAAMKRAPCWYHCFVADAQFQRLYKNFWRYREILKYVSGMIGTDFSLFRDYDLETKIENCRKNRAVDYAIQQMGVPLIPTAGFADEETWSWCFDGLPTHSTVAVTTNCIGCDPEAKRLFIGGISAMVAKLQPTAIVVCGVCPEWLPEKYSSIEIIQIPSYSQMWKARRSR